MLKRRGFTLIELMVTLSILAFSLALVAPSFSGWVQNSKVRSYAESLQNALQFARSEAVRRNTPVSLQITTTLDNNCALATANVAAVNFWVITAGTVNAAGVCGNAISTDAVATSAAITTGAGGPFILQKGPVETSLNTLNLNPSQIAITFNGLGRLVAGAAAIVPGQAAAATTYQITSPNGACVAANGNVRCLNLVVQPAGQVRMCDPSLPAAGANDPMAC